MQQEAVNITNSSQKNIIVIGKTGSGKSYFLNMLLMEEKPNKGPFKVFQKSDSGTQECHIEIDKLINYGSTEKEAIILNIIDTPGLFDTKDDQKEEHQNNNEPQSIKHLKNIQATVMNDFFQSQFNRVILVCNSREKLDTQIKGMIEISKIIVGQTLKMCVLITCCQYIYDKEQDEEEEIMQKLENLQGDWRQQFANYDIEDVFFLANYSIKAYKDKNDKLSQFYFTQWQNLYQNLAKSLKTKISIWDNLSPVQQMSIAQYFNYKLNKPQQQIEKEIKLTVGKEEENTFNDQQNQEREKYQQKQKELKLEEARRSIQETTKQQEQNYQEINKQKQLSEDFLKDKMDQLQKQKEELDMKIKLQNIQEKELKFKQEQVEFEAQKNAYRQSFEQTNRPKFPPQDPEGRYQQYYNKKGECVSLDVGICSINNDQIKLKKQNLFNQKIKIKGIQELSNICLGYLHYSERFPCDFISFNFQGSEKLESVDLTPNHLIYSSNRNRFIQAKKLTLDDTLMYISSKGECSSVKIIEIQQVIKKGYYAPLTSRGYFFGNRVLLSSYVSPSEFPVGQVLAHLAMKPLILYRQLTMKYQNQVDLKEVQEYQAPYTIILQKIFC